MAEATLPTVFSGFPMPPGAIGTALGEDHRWLCSHTGSCCLLSHSPGEHAGKKKETMNAQCKIYALIITNGGEKHSYLSGWTPSENLGAYGPRKPLLQVSSQSGIIISWGIADTAS